MLIITDKIPGSPELPFQKYLATVISPNKKKWLKIHHLSLFDRVCIIVKCATSKNHIQTTQTELTASYSVAFDSFPHS